MSRIDRVRFYVDNIISDISDKDKQRAAYIHVYGVAQCCVLLAAKRGLDTLLTQVMGLLHDVYSYKIGVKELHSVNGAEMVRVAFKRELVGLFTDEEQIAVRCAVFHHSDKANKHGEYEELLKDADVLQHWLYDKTMVVGRTIELGKELGLYIDAKQEPYAEIAGNQVFEPESFADIACKLAFKNVKGDRTDEDFMEIIRYFPESTAFDELINAWCAAFVYHCAYLAGLRLPIRYTPSSNTRFACVEAWLEWGQENGFCHKDGEGFTPSRGDIVIYDNIIPSENKPENSPWYDHIGIVLDITEDKLSVAEGNAGNLNISEIVKRERNKNIGCYIRIPRDYNFDGWKIDYRKAIIYIPKNHIDKHR
ncbi:MAG: HD domain-containing protein [Eubacteriales bacterium]